MDPRHKGEDDEGGADPAIARDPSVGAGIFHLRFMPPTEVALPRALCKSADMVDESETSAGHPARKLGPVAKALGALFLILCIGGILPHFSMIVGRPFLPSQQYYQEYAWYGYFISIVVWLIFAYFMAFSEKYKSYYENNNGNGYITGAFSIVFGALLLSLLSFQIIIVTCPMVAALIWGDTVVLSYTVRDGRWGSSRNCHDTVTLVSMPSLFSRVCRVPDELRSRLSTGTRIELVGHGTEYGLFYDTIRLAPTEANTRNAPGDTWTPEGFGAFTGPVLDLPGSGRR